VAPWFLHKQPKKPMDNWCNSTGDPSNRDVKEVGRLPWVPSNQIVKEFPAIDRNGREMSWSLQLRAELFEWLGDFSQLIFFVLLIDDHPPPIRESKDKLV